jgi:mono/diheme cytochrome c family protein
MKKRQVQLGLVLFVVVVAAGIVAWPSQAQRATANATQRAFINDYCVSCHSQKAKTAGVVLEGLEFNRLSADADIWEKVLRKVRTGQMPPAKAPKPESVENSAFVTWLESSLDRAARLNPNPGRPAAHRLNRAEYSNAIRDLLSVDIQPGQWLPVDDSGHGFDNIGEVLTLSPALLEKYLVAARRVSRLAVGDKTIKPAEDRFQPAKNSRNEKVSDDLPFFSRGGVAVNYYFPLDGEYLIRVKPQSGDSSRFFDVRVPVKAGLRTVGVTFPRQSAKVEPNVPPPNRFAQPQPPPAPQRVPLDVRLDGARIKRFEVNDNLNIENLIVSGPFNVTGRGETASRKKVFVCRPTAEAEEPACAKKILTALARRAFRRPVNDSDVTPLLSFFDQGKSEGDFDTGIQQAVEAMLVSPDFLFRIERDPKTSASVYRLNDLELASRLSFFLWSSIPDDELLTLAEQGKLKSPVVLQQQIQRLLSDSRSQAFVKNFGGQWLHLRNLETATPDPEIFPGFDDNLRAAFSRETELFFESVLRENRSVTDLLDADFTYLNQRLAEHYGIRGVYGPQFRRVALDAKQRATRGGLLGQGSILTVTSYPNRTSVVQRGKWILENLLGSPPPPPPPDIPDLKPKSSDGRLLSMREQLDVHRSNAICASCHARMDPIGFALENFDGVGKWRTKDAGLPIDASGKLPNGKIFTGVPELKKILLTDHRDEFITTVTEKLLTYALGRGLEGHDAPAVREIIRESAKDNHRLSAMIAAIINSKPFQMRKRS